MLTIAELAQELNISKNAVMHRIDTLKMRDELKKQGNRFLLTEEQAERVRTTYGMAKPQEQNETLQGIIDTLKEELQNKNKQIDDLLAIIKTQQVTIAGIQQKEILEITDKQNSNTEQIPQRKPRFWHRIFSRSRATATTNTTGEENTENEQA